MPRILQDCVIVAGKRVSVTPCVCDSTYTRTASTLEEERGCAGRLLRPTSSWVSGFLNITSRVVPIDTE